MRPHPRIRKTVKWGGALVSVLLLVVWLGSGWYGYGWSSGRGYWHGVDRGHVFASFYSGMPAGSFGSGWRGYGHSALWYWKPSAGFLMGGWQFSLPIWILLCLSLLVTALAWRLDILARRRAMVHLCQKCRYDRTGLAPGAICPECGAAAPAPPLAAL